MSNQDSTSEFDKALDLMESSSDSSDKKWEDLKDVETLDACKDLMDVRYLLHKCQASGMVDVEAELARLKGRQNKKKYLKMFWIWSSSVAAILVGAFVSFNYLFNIPVTPQRGQGFDRIAERIYKYPEVKSVYLISGGYDLLVTLEEKSLKEIAGFVSDKLSTLDSVLSTATHFILKKYKDQIGRASCRERV